MEFGIAQRVRIYNWTEVVHVDNISLQKDPAREKILIGEAVYGESQIGSSPVNAQILGNCKFDWELPFFAFARLVIDFPGAISPRGHFCAKCYDCVPLYGW